MKILEKNKTMILWGASITSLCAGILASIFPQYTSWVLIFISMILFSIPTLYSLQKNNQTIFGFSLLAIILFVLEVIGAKTGILYGDFHYNEALSFPIFLGTPIAMILVWPSLVIGSSVIVSSSKKMVQPILSGIILVLFDLVMDPLAVQMGIWDWGEKGFWFGVPFSNFVGWFLLGFLGTLLINVLNIQIKERTLAIFSLVLFLSFWIGFGLNSSLYLLSIFGVLLLLYIMFSQKHITNNFFK